MTGHGIPQGTYGLPMGFHGPDDWLSTAATYWTKHGVSGGLHRAADVVAPESTAAFDAMMKAREEEDTRQKNAKMLRDIALAGVAIVALSALVNSFRGKK